MIQIEHLMACLIGLSEVIVLSSRLKVTCTYGLISNPVKVPYFQYRACWYLYRSGISCRWLKNPRISNLSLIPPLDHGHDPAAVPKFGYNGTLLIRNFVTSKTQIIKFKRVPSYWNFGTVAWCRDSNSRFFTTSA
jgi:hypothetical protein